MKGTRREKIINYSGLLRTLDGLVPYLRENFVYVDKNQPLTGDAPKLFIREYEYGTALKNNPDRKSTRLNSSHVAISYAVFCLKKKTINLNLTTPINYLQMMLLTDVVRGYHC